MFVRDDSRYRPAQLAGRAEDIAVIVAKSVLLDNVSVLELGRIFRGEKAAAVDGTMLGLTTREKGSPARAAVLGYVYKFGGVAFERFFSQQIFTETRAVVPKLLTSGAAMKKVAVAAPGTSGHVGLPRWTAASRS